MKISGKNSVIERLRSNPHSVKKIYIQQGIDGVASIRKKAKQWGIPVLNVPKSKIVKMARNTNTQGVLIDVDGFEYIECDALLDDARKKKRVPIFLDSLNDPQNLGAIIRSVACLGKFALILPTHNSVSVTESVLRVASGGDNYVPIAQVSNMNQAIQKAKEKGFWIVGSVVGEDNSIYNAEFPFPMALVMGSEQKGIRGGIRKNLDMEFSIPMALNTLSFNVAHATAIFCYEIKKQQYQKKLKD
ncbi:MAG: 23S rRNA (guanosine(2251)-2'-O)-methyltransferase RlmB [Candidatus Omnitrophica bacterium]|nr:23S rRNA (guanosine(2251)-2'-O)-methyltransferase RlmB [Candidatus Omnitrophota bacterium]